MEDYRLEGIVIDTQPAKDVGKYYVTVGVFGLGSFSVAHSAPIKPGSKVFVLPKLGVYQGRLIVRAELQQ